MSHDVPSIIPRCFNVTDVGWNQHRPTWPEVWMDFASSIARRSHESDHEKHVGAVVVTNDNTQVLSVGYNGTHRGASHERESEEPGGSGYIHAETNCIAKLDYNHPKKRTMYVTTSPCVMCAKLIVNANIDRVVYRRRYRDPRGIEILLSSGIAVTSIDDAIRSEQGK